MKRIFTDLVERFDNGTLSRRELIQGLTAIAAAGAATPAKSQETPFESRGIDHVSIQVTDLARSIEFYERIFGLSVLNEDEPNKISRMGTTRVIVSLHEKPPTGIVDHFAIAVAGFDRDSAAAALGAHGLTAEQNLDYGFHVRDPEGMPVQIVGARDAR
jgi:catechol 2,3-dioxygenase-like lactoylglutathione lyase family enzyme